MLCVLQDSDDEGGGPASKKFRGGAAVAEDEEDEAAEAASGYKQSVDLSVGGSDAWKRPPLASINPATESIC